MRENDLSVTAAQCTLSIRVSSNVSPRDNTLRIVLSHSTIHTHTHIHAQTHIHIYRHTDDFRFLFNWPIFQRLLDKDTHLTAIFQDNPWKPVLECLLLDYIGAKDDVRCGKLQSNRHHRQTNIQGVYTDK